MTQHSNEEGDMMVSVVIGNSVKQVRAMEQVRAMKSQLQLKTRYCLYDITQSHTVEYTHEYMHVRIYTYMQHRVIMAMIDKI